jgi:hypothetical protein
VKPVKLRNKKKYLKKKKSELETNSKYKNIGDVYNGVNEFKKD